MANSAQFDMNDILRDLDKLNIKGTGEGIVLFLGETGSGKSTLTQFIAGSHNLVSVGENGNFTIQDTNRGISSREEANKSKTIYPELVPYADSSGMILLMDTPGYGDNRSSQMEANCALHMKNALRYFPKIKIVLVCSLDDIIIGGQREGFVRLIKHAVTFLKNFDGFEKSIGLIVTKIPATVIKERRSRRLKSDDEWKQNIISDLKRMSNGIKEETNKPGEKNLAYNSTLKVIDILLSGNNSIDIFRCPEKAGPIYGMEPFPDCKESLRKLVSNLQYASVQADNFGFTISDTAKQSIGTEILHIVEKAKDDLENFLKLIERSYDEYEMCEQDVSKIFQEFQKQNQLWEQQLKKINQMKRTSDVLKFLLQMLEDEAKSPLISKYATTDAQNAQKEIFENLSKYAKFLDILELVSNTRLSITTTKPWETLFQRTQEKFDEGESWYESISRITRVLQDDIKSSFDSTKASIFLIKLQEWIDTNKPVPAQLFKKSFGECCQHANVVRIKYDLSVVKLQKLLNHLKANDILVDPYEDLIEEFNKVELTPERFNEIVEEVLSWLV